jgi:hypothetical protein
VDDDVLASGMVPSDGPTAWCEAPLVAINLSRETVPVPFFDTLRDLTKSEKRYEMYEMLRKKIEYQFTAFSCKGFILRDL